VATLNYNNYSDATANWATGTNITYQFIGDVGDLYAVKPSGSESALAWLDRRVAEVCVKL